MAYTTSPAKNLESGICRGMDAGLASRRTSHRAFVGVTASLFATSAALTIVWCASMSTMRGMPMPGGWALGNNPTTSVSLQPDYASANFRLA